MSDRPELVVFSPLPPSRSGIADYFMEQLPYWKARWRLSVVVDQDPSSVEGIPGDVEVIPYARWRREERNFTLPRLYQIGNNAFHEFAFKEALQSPGVVVLHDFVLHHLTVEMTLARGSDKEYERILIQEWGDVGRSVARQRQAGVFTEFQQFLMPLNGRLVDSSQGVVVHSDWARRRLAVRHDIPVAHVPHHYYPPPEEVRAVDQASARDYFDMDPSKVVLLCAGHVTPPKRVEHVVRALGRVREHMPGFELWVVGEAGDREALEREIEVARVSDVTRVTGYVSADALQYAFRAADVVFNLRYPSAGESSGTLTRALGMGCCCVVYDYAAFGDIPNSAAVKLPVTDPGDERLANEIVELARDSNRRLTIGAGARAYVAKECAIEYCVAEQSRFLANVTSAHSLRGEPA